MLTQNKALIVAVLTTILTGGCTMPNPLPNDKQPVTIESKTTTADRDEEQLGTLNDAKKTDILWLLQYYRLVSTLPSKALNDEYQRAKVEFETAITVKNQWQLAVLLCVPNTPFYDAEYSSTLFKGLTNETFEHNPLLNDAAFLMYTLVNEQNKIIKKSAQLENQLNESQSVNKTLQDQLNALKAIENTLYQRNKAEGKPKP